MAPDPGYISGQCSTQSQAVSLPITPSTLLSVLPFLCQPVSDLGRTRLYSCPGWFHWRERPKEDIFSLCLLSLSYMINHLFVLQERAYTCLPFYPSTQSVQFLVTSPFSFHSFILMLAIWLNRTKD